MQAATHIAGAVLTLAVARGFGLEIGPFEAVAVIGGSLLPDIDTTTAGAGRYIRPVSGWIETRYGHRTVTHSLVFALVVAAPFWPVSPTVSLALLYGILSHLLLDALNVNGLPFLLWPWRHTFWFFRARTSRIRYGSAQETGLAVGLALGGVLLWPISADTFGTAFRRVIATPELAVTDYMNWHTQREVWAQIEGFNADTQEKIDGRFRVIEALGRNGVLVENGAGDALEVSANGQVVAYRIRVYPGEGLSVLDSRVSVGGRLLRDVLAAVPNGARAYLTGNLELSAPINLPPPSAGTFARVAGTDRLTLHSARPADLAPFAAAYVVAGSLVVRLEGNAGAKLGYQLPAQASKVQTRTVRLDGLPSLAGVLVERRAKVLEGQPLARYVDASSLADLDAQIAGKKQVLGIASVQIEQARQAYQVQRDALARELVTVAPELERLRFLVGRDAEPRQSLEGAEAKVKTLQSKQTDLAVTYSATAADARGKANALALEVQQLRAHRERAATAQVVRAPVSGEVAEIRVKDATQAGVSVEIVLISEVPNANN